MKGKKGFCPKLQPKSAIYEPDVLKYKCHICGTEFDENKFELLGNYKVFQDYDDERIRFVKFEVEEGMYKIINDGGQGYYYHQRVQIIEFHNQFLLIFFIFH